MITNLGFILVWYDLSVNFNQYQLTIERFCSVTDFQRREFLFMRLKAILLDGFISTARSALSSNMPPQSGCPDQNQKGNMKKVKEEDDASDGNLDGTGQQQPDCEMRIKKNEKMLLSADDRLLVRLDMDDSHNLLMFWYTRIILQDYGRPYLLRLQFYIGTFIIFCVLVGVQLAAFLFGYLESMTIVAQYQSVAILIMMLVLVLRVLFHGLAANNERKLHAEQLFKKSVRLYFRICYSDKSNTKKKRSC
ncbi:hypothetical protein BC828DRAFT_51038 [Blastocladiella britannica]|nr:hypothetical protein BC828DRAFT_51038 [Blastocladiella britannica]